MIIIIIIVVVLLQGGRPRAEVRCGLLPHALARRALRVISYTIV